MNVGLLILHSFVRGLASLMDVRPPASLDTPSWSSSSDAEALASDWRMVLGDMSRAFEGEIQRFDKQSLEYAKRIVMDDPALDVTQADLEDVNEQGSTTS